MLFLSPEQSQQVFFPPTRIHNSVVSQGEMNSPLGQNECAASETAREANVGVNATESCRI